MAEGPLGGPRPLTSTTTTLMFQFEETFRGIDRVAKLIEVHVEDELEVSPNQVVVGPDNAKDTVAVELKLSGFSLGDINRLEQVVEKRVGSTDYPKELEDIYFLSNF